MRLILALLALIPTPSSAQDPSEGADLFVSYCATCHGLEARGDGPMAPILTILPADLSRISERNGGAFPTLRVARQIDGRDPLLAHGGQMPVFGNLFSDQVVAIPGPGGQPIMVSQSIADIMAWLQTVQE
ncbi:MAG: cytochrome c [Pseudomonadota bacterium]